MPKALKYIVGGAVGAGITTLLIGGTAFAADEDPVAVLGTQTNLLWVVIGAVLVIFMQAGFALVETGFTQKKNAAHVMSTNFAIFGLGFVGFLFVGFPLAFGGFSFAAFGLDTPMNAESVARLGQLGLPVEGLGSPRQRRDAGAVGVLPLHGGVHGHDRDDPDGVDGRALEVEELRHLGPVLRCDLLPALRCVDMGWRLAGQDVGHDEPRYRLRRLRRLRCRARRRWCRRPRRCARPRTTHRQVRARRQARTIPGHNIPMAQLGCFILLFGWFGFNAASTLAVTDIQFATVATNTAIAAAVGAVVAMYYMMAKSGKPDPGMMVNGMLAGLVAITAPCAFVAPWAAALIGAVAAIIVIEAALFIERKGIDDPVGAIAVHGVGGIFGVLCVGIFANGQIRRGLERCGQG